MLWDDFGLCEYLRHIVTREQLVLRGWTKTAFPRDGISEVYRALSISVMAKGHHAVGGVIRELPPMACKPLPSFIHSN